MWNYNYSYPDELYHYGVKGMRWGHRKVEPRSLSERYYSFRANRYKKHANAVQKDIDSFKGHEKGIKTNSGKVLLSAQDVKDSVNALKSVRNKSLAKFKKYENKAESSRKAYNAKNESSKSKMSTAKKMAIGAGIAAAVVGTGVAVYGIKTGKIKLGKKSVSKVIEKTRKYSSDGSIFANRKNTLEMEIFRNGKSKRYISNKNIANSRFKSRDIKNLNPSNKKTK